MSKSKRVLMAILIAPWAVVPVAFLYFLAVAPSDAILGLIFGLAGVSFAYFGTITVGVPANFLLMKFGALRGWLLALVGVAAGVVAAVSTDSHQLGLLWALCGGTVGLVAWGILQWEKEATATSEV